jgi:maleylpyruvate isomerase
VVFMKLFDNNLSSASYRVRIALHLKGIEFTKVPIIIHGDDPDNVKIEYKQINPQGLVPSLLTDDGVFITQSLSIIEYIDEIHHDFPLFPETPPLRALARSVALVVACDTHPFGAPRVARYLSQSAGFSAAATQEWVRNWVTEGLTSVERLLTRHREGPFAVGPRPSVADVFLAPQAAVAERVGLDLATWPVLAGVVAHCRQLPAFVVTAPGYAAVEMQTRDTPTASAPIAP